MYGDSGDRRREQAEDKRRGHGRLDRLAMHVRRNSFDR
jgi:hypothetical protein